MSLFSDRPRWGRPLAFVSLLAFFASAAFAQETTGQLLGTVSDPSGATIPEAKLILAGPRIPNGLTTTSSADGSYLFAAVPPGKYSLTVSKAGFSSIKQDGIEITLGARFTYNPSLKLGQVADTIEVRESAVSLDTTSSRTSTNITQSQFENLSKGRTFQSLLALAPGARYEPKSSTAGAGGISIDGASGIENVYVVDGVEVSDNINGSLKLNNALPFEFVQEVQVKSAGFEAEYGGATGGVINVVTRGGANDFHGLVKMEGTGSPMNASDRGYWQQSVANADVAEFFKPREDGYRVLYPGVSLGGRLIRDKMFFFGSYQPEFEHTERVVPYAEGTRTYTQDRSRQYTLGRLDYNVSSKLQTYGTWTWSPSRRTGGLPSRDERLRPLSQDQSVLGGYIPAQQVSAGATYALTSRLVLTGRYGYKYFNDKDSNYGLPGAAYVQYQTSPTVVGNPGPTSNPNYIPGIPASFQYLRGGSNVGSTSNTFQDITTRHNLYLDGTYITSLFGQQHTFKVGYQLSRVSEDLRRDYTNGWFQLYWNDAFSRGDITNQRGNYGYYLWNDSRAQGKVGGHNQGFYVQDAWRPHKNVTLNLGVRLENELIPAFRKEYQGIKLEDKLLSFGFGDKIAPRIGGAWDIFGDGKWKLSGSFGLFYDVVKLSMTQSASGANIYFVTAYKLDDPDVSKLNRANPGALGSAITTYDLRKILITPDGKWNGINKNVSPSASREFTFTLDHQLASRLVASLRYTRKNLLRAIEDISVLDAQGNELLFRDNPGFGYTRNDPNHLYDLKTPDGKEFLFPKAVRQYDGAEFRLQGQLKSAQFVTSYTWSRLYGNYAGLSNSDEAGRSDPNRSRAFDSPYEYFDASGSQRNQLGLLGTDRPHTFKLFGSYEFKHKLGGTTFGINQVALSGTPDSTQFTYLNASTFPYGRGDMGRTPWYTQTDLLVSHTIKVKERSQIRLEADVRNLFNQAAVISRSFQLNRSSNVGSAALPVSQFFAGYNPYDYIKPGGSVPYNPVYRLPAGTATGGVASTALSSAASLYNPNFGAYQDFRVIRLGARFLF